MRYDFIMCQFFINFVDLLLNGFFIINSRLNHEIFVFLYSKKILVDNN